MKQLSCLPENTSSEDLLLLSVAFGAVNNEDFEATVAYGEFQHAFTLHLRQVKRSSLQTCQTFTA